jgi:hypothetical protein
MISVRLSHRSEDRAPRVPDEEVHRGSSRSVPDNTTGLAACLDAREPSRGGNLTRKRSLVQIQYGPRHFSKTCLTLKASMGASRLRFCSLIAGRAPSRYSVNRRVRRFGILGGGPASRRRRHLDAVNITESEGLLASYHTDYAPFAHRTGHGRRAQNCRFWL